MLNGELSNEMEEPAWREVWRWTLAHGCRTIPAACDRGKAKKTSTESHGLRNLAQPVIAAEGQAPSSGPMQIEDRPRRL